MADDELIFEGLNAAECSDFIRKIHKLAYEERRHRDSEWMADRAMICFAGDALLWYHRQPLETQEDWILLRGALLTHYVSSSQAARPEPAAARLPEQTALPIEVTSDGPSSAMIPGSFSTFLYRVKVVASGYVGYVCKAYGNGSEGRCPILTPDRAEAMLVSETYTGSGGIALKIAGSERDGYSEFLCLAGRDSAYAGYIPTTWSGWLVAARQVSQTNYFSSNDDATYSPGVVSKPWLTDKCGVLSAASFFPISWNQRNDVLNWNCSPDTWKSFTNKLIAVIGETPSGGKTLYFWSRKVWEDEDEQFVVQMYLERVA